MQTIRVNRGQTVLGRERNDEPAIVDRKRIRKHDQAAIRDRRELLDRALDLGGIAHGKGG